MGWLGRVAGDRAPNLGRPSASADPLAWSSLEKKRGTFSKSHSQGAAGVPGLWPPLKFSPEPIANWYHRVASDGAQGGCTEPGSAQRLGGPPWPLDLRHIPMSPGPPEPRGSWAASLPASFEILSRARGPPPPEGGYGSQGAEAQRQAPAAGRAPAGAPRSVWGSSPPPLRGGILQKIGGHPAHRVSEESASRSGTRAGRGPLAALEVGREAQELLGSALAPSFEILSRANRELFPARICEPQRDVEHRAGDRRRADPGAGPRRRPQRASLVCARRERTAVVPRTTTIDRIH